MPFTTYMGSNFWQYQSDKSNQFWNMTIAISRPLLKEREIESYQKKFEDHQGSHLLVSDINSSENVFFPIVERIHSGEWTSDFKHWLGPYYITKNLFIECTDFQFRNNNPVIFNEYDMNTLRREANEIINNWNDNEIRLYYTE